MNRALFAELKCFVAVAERRSFARAAADIGTAPSSVSQTIRTFEERLGVRLFNRSTRHVSLTDAGARLLVRVRPSIEELDNAVRGVMESRDAPSGTLRLNVSAPGAQIVLSDCLGEFLARHPLICVDIIADEGDADYFEERFDAGIRIARDVPARMEQVSVTAPSRLIAVASPDYLDRHSPPVVPADLLNHNCIRIRRRNSVLPWTFTDRGRTMDMEVTGTLVVNTMGLAIQGACDGIGIAFAIERYVQSHLDSGALVPLLGDRSVLDPGYCLYYSRTQQPTVALRSLIAFLLEQR